MPPIVQSVELPNRVTLPYVEQGDPSGVPVVLLHAIADSWRSFERVLSDLPESIHAFALTQRGHGTRAVPRGATIPAISRRIWRRSWTRSTSKQPSWWVVPVVASSPGASRLTIRSAPWDSFFLARQQSCETNRACWRCGTRRSRN